jgi:hypothetical protein
MALPFELGKGGVYRALLASMDAISMRPVSLLSLFASELGLRLLTWVLRLVYSLTSELAWQFLAALNPGVSSAANITLV